jgi:hypothetical protein
MDLLRVKSSIRKSEKIVQEEMTTDNCSNIETDELISERQEDRTECGYNAKRVWSRIS